MATALDLPENFASLRGYERKLAYWAAWKRKKRKGLRPAAICHLDRPAYVSGECRPCYRDRHGRPPENRGRRPASCHPNHWSSSGGRCRACYRASLKKQSASCHPEQLAYGRGLCKSCWRKSPDRRRASCHPDRPHIAKGLCEHCWNTQYRVPLREKINKAQVSGRLRRLLASFGFDATTSEAWLKKQGNRCAICGTENGLGKRWSRLAIDHDHGRNQPRGLLCGACNLGLGNFQDDIGRLLAAVNYLKGKGGPRDGGTPKA